MYLHPPPGRLWGLLVKGFGRRFDKRPFSCHGEAAAAGGLGEALRHIGQGFFQR